MFKQIGKEDLRRINGGHHSRIAEGINNNEEAPEIIVKAVETLGKVVREVFVDFGVNDYL